MGVEGVAGQRSLESELQSLGLGRPSGLGLQRQGPGFGVPSLSTSTPT